MGTSQASPEARASTTSVRTSEASPKAQGDSNFSPIAHHTQQKTGPVIQALLIKAVGPQGKPVFVHVPFTTSDLLNWKQCIGFYRDNPAAVNQLLETIMITHNPKWGDMRALLSIFFTAEEKTMVLEKAQEEMRQRHPRGEAEELVLIKKDSKWDPNTSRGQQLIEQYRQLILYGIQHGIPKTKNLSKLYEVHQGLDESPYAFFEHLCQAARRWMDLDLEDKKNRKMLVVLFIQQLTPDIRKKLQKVEGRAGMSVSQMTAIAYKVYKN